VTTVNWPRSGRVDIDGDSTPTTPRRMAASARLANAVISASAPVSAAAGAVQAVDNMPDHQPTHRPTRGAGRAGAGITPARRPRVVGLARGGVAEPARLLRQGAPKRTVVVTVARAGTASLVPAAIGRRRVVATQTPVDSAMVVARHARHRSSPLTSQCRAHPRSPPHNRLAWHGKAGSSAFAGGRRRCRGTPRAAGRGARDGGADRRPRQKEES
jgi:hypothetical protein